MFTFKSYPPFSNGGIGSLHLADTNFRMRIVVFNKLKGGNIQCLPFSNNFNPIIKSDFVILFGFDNFF